MDRRVALVVSGVLVLVALGNAQADEARCRKRAAAKAAALYQQVAKEFGKCSGRIAARVVCDVGGRDAKIASKLGKTRTIVLGSCDDTVAAGLGFPTGGDLAVRLVGAAAGEGRQVTDTVYGRDPAPRSPAEQRCASVLSSLASKAGKKTVKTLITCGATCGSPEQTAIDTLFSSASARIGGRCDATELGALIGGDLAAYLAAVRAGAERVAAAMGPGVKPSLSVVAPSPGSILTPPSLPTSVDVVSQVGNVPHAGYVNSVEVNGHASTFDPATGYFQFALSVLSPKTNFPIVLRARTTFGTVTTTANLHFNLGTLVPGVVITSPASGTITAAGSITVSGQVIGDLGAADILLVDGALTPFDLGTGAFSRLVTIGPGAVNIIPVSVESLSLATTNTDSVVVLKGTALSLGTRVPNANFNRLNNSGFSDVRTILEDTINGFLDPSLIGAALDNGTLCEFSLGTRTSSIGAVGANTLQASLSIDNLHVKICDYDIGIEDCDITVNASNALLVTQADLFGQLQANVTSTQLNLNGTSVSISSGFFCTIADALASLAGIEQSLEDKAQSEAQSALPGALNTALGEINISGPIGTSLDVNIDAVYTSIPEDSGGVTYILDSNIVATSPVPDAPPITATLVPTPLGPPVLGPTIPLTATPYDLGFCLSDGFVNRAMAAFMRQGRFNQSLDTLLGVPLTTGIISSSVVLDDPTYNTTCPNCPVTLVIKPTAAAVSRAPEPGEDGTVVITVPNYRMDVVADDGGTPLLLISGLVTFDLPITLNAAGAHITPTVGTLSVLNVKVVDNPSGGDEVKFATKVAALFPQAASALGALFGEINLPTFQGLTVTGAGSGYNVSCTAIYMNLSPP